MATATLRTKKKHLIDQPSRHNNVKVYLLFKVINQGFYTNVPRLSHWQVICHFKDTRRYKCYELQTDNGDKNGYIKYNVSDFNYDDVIYYYNIGKCAISERELENKCKQIMINKLKYILGVRDCQTWATLLIENLGLYINGSAPLLIKEGMGTFYPPYLFDNYLQTFTSDNLSRPIDLFTNFHSIFNLLLSRVKRCNGYRNLQSRRKLPFAAYLCSNNSRS